MRGKPQALQLSGGERRRAAVERNVAKAKIDQRIQPLDQFAGKALGGDPLLVGEIGRAAYVGRSLVRRTSCRDSPFDRRIAGRLAEDMALRDRRGAPVFAMRDGREQIPEFQHRQVAELGNVKARELHGQGFALQALAVAGRAIAADDILRDALLHQRAFSVGEGFQHITARAGEGALVARLHAALERRPGLCGRQARIDRHRRCLFSEEDPVAILFRQVAPRRIDIIAERNEDIAQVLAMPGGRPGGDRPVANGEAVVRNHGLFGRVIDAPDAVTGRAGAGDRVGGEILRIEHGLMARIFADAGIKHPHQAGDRRHAADRGSRVGRAALLLQRDRRRQPVDRVDLRHAGLVDQATGIGRNRFQITSLGFGIKGAECER